MGQNRLSLGIVTAYIALQKCPVNSKCQVFLILSELSNPELCKFRVLSGLKACFKIKILDFFSEVLHYRCTSHVHNGMGMFAKIHVLPSRDS